MERLLYSVNESTRDWLAAARMWRLWTALGYEDLIERYRRSVFGVTWVVASFAAFILVYTLVFDNSMLADDAAKERDRAQRTAAFTRALQNMKTLAEGGTLPPPPPRAGGPGAAPGAAPGRSN